MAIEVGEQVQGTVTNITHFGAFVDLGDDKTGLVHISEIADHFVKDINDELARGDEITVKVLNIEDNGNIALSIKQSDQPKQAEELKAKRQTKDSNHQADSAKEKSSQPPYQAKKVANKQSFGKKSSKANQSFDDLMSNFLKNSEERLTSLKRNTENKRGGRGGRRS